MLLKSCKKQQKEVKEAASSDRKTCCVDITQRIKLDVYIVYVARHGNLYRSIEY